MNQPPAAPARRMTVLPLVGALYLMVSGGPYGLEELAHKVGFGAALVVLLATPLVWSAPTALMVGELASALPEEGGYYAWVRRALGPFWGFQEAWLSLVASVFDMGLYPTLFALYLGRLSPALGAHPVLVGLAMITAGVLWNLRGASSVGNGSFVMTGLVIAPFLILALLAWVHGPGLTMPPPKAIAPDLAGGVVVAMWNYMGWDNASTVAGEVVDPQRTYPRAVFAAVGLVTLAYVIPVAAMHAAKVDPSDWDTGSWVDVARVYGGAPLAFAIVVFGMVSAFGMFSALCMSASRLPVVLAEDGYLPKILTKRLSKTDAPWVSLIVCAIAWSTSLGLSFERLVSLDILFYGTSLILEFVALVALRIREPNLPRPFRVPGGMPVAALLGIGPLALLGLAVVKNANEQFAGMNALVFGAALMMGGPILYGVARAVRKRV